MSNEASCALRVIRNETLSQEDFDMTDLVKTAQNIAIAILEETGACAARVVKSVAYVTLLLGSAAATADDAPVPTQVVDLATKLAGGPHPGFRAFHAKGVVVEGSFKASTEAGQLSRATLFNGHTVPITVRFSDGP